MAESGNSVNMSYYDESSKNEQESSKSEDFFAEKEQIVLS